MGGGLRRSIGCGRLAVGGSVGWRIGGWLFLFVIVGGRSIDGGDGSAVASVLWLRVWWLRSVTKHWSICDM